MLWKEEGGEDGVSPEPAQSNAKTLAELEQTNAKA
jgi:hypothetical protein